VKQWFTGKFRGHYRGHPTKGSELSPYAGTPHFRIEVYEALVSEITLGPLVFEPEPGKEPQDEEHGHHTPTGPTLHQSHIGKVHLIDPVRPGQTLLSTAHDVLMSGFELSRGAESKSGSVGHIEGTISGFYRPPPPPPEVEEIPAPKGPPPVGFKTEVLEQETGETGATEVEPSKEPRKKRPLQPKQALPRALKEGTADATKALRLDADIDSDEELDAVLSEEAPSVEYPFFTIGVVITLLLAFLATPFSAVLFGSTFLLSYGIRRWLLGVVPDVAPVRFLSLFLGSTQILVAALLVAHFATLGCVALSPLPLIWLLGAQMTASLLPRPLPFALTTVGFAAVLFQAYASWAPPPCRSDAPSHLTTETAPPAARH
jgi:hypothetical protein